MAKNNSSDHENEKENSSDDESEEEEENYSDDESKKENSSDDESEKDNSSDDESEKDNPKAGAIKKRKVDSVTTQTQTQCKPRKIVEEDDTEETLKLLLQWIKNGESKISRPDRIDECVVGIAIYTKCIYKQLTESDVSVSQNRLMLGKHEVKDKFLSHLEESEIPGVEGVNVLVYGPDGKVHEMKFKIWIKNTPVLMNGWSKFVGTYKLQKYSDVLRIWMFRASKDRQICFVIDSTRFDGITKQFSKRILKKVFK